MVFSYTLCWGKRLIFNGVFHKISFFFVVVAVVYCPFSCYHFEWTDSFFPWWGHQYCSTIRQSPPHSSPTMHSLSHQPAFKSLFIKFIIYDQIAENLIHLWHIFKWATANLCDSFHRPIVYWPLNLIVKSNLIWMKCICVCARVCVGLLGHVWNNMIDDLSNYYLRLIFILFNFQS